MYIEWFMKRNACELMQKLVKKRNGLTRFSLFSPFFISQIFTK